MLCDSCKKADATVFLTQIIEGKMQKVNLCEPCAKEKGVEESSAFAMADLLLGLGATQQITHAHPTLHCPVCDYTQSDFKKTGRLGCSACYDTFADGLSNLLKGMHKGIKHTGKMPAHLLRQRSFSEKLQDLQNKLLQAVKTENYENAARLRDEIHKLKNEKSA